MKKLMSPSALPHTHMMTLMELSSGQKELDNTAQVLGALGVVDDGMRNKGA